MNLIVAADKNWAIGNRQDLLVRIPADMKMFREMTMGNVLRKDTNPDFIWDLSPIYPDAAAWRAA